MVQSRADQKNWQETVKAWRISGQTQTEFCRLENIKPYQLHYYKRNLEGVVTPASSKTDRTSGFARVAVSNASAAIPPPGLQVALPNGIIVSALPVDNLSLIKKLIGMVT